ncbi:MAG TPA: bifunctional adenosylcobinamide kinase/adenosylcobinamide-phosphate guanylyltransferase [Coleofasciculaceae cyanobacterium]|jgi:adenosylcobinamide kinase/adenosylcobinamide-phosphate guanylyltransferase
MSNTQKIILITGPSSSGKSEFAETLAAKTHKSVIYIATAKTDDRDREWQARIIRHQQRRPSHWRTVTAAEDLSLYIEQAVATECLLIDSLGTWVANFLESERIEWQQISDRFLASLQNTKAKTILVAEETGWGVVPAYPLGRLFRDRLGHLSRQAGNIADTTYLVASGHVLNLSLLGEPLSKYEI